ncbi:MAG: leucine dehydrogenase [Firmicutes bacterium]|nr:leucine dehydrogenase [Bacillota bacterium]
MKIFDEMAKNGHEQLIFNYDRTTGLKAIIAIHDTTLGPALGGCRMWNYSSEEEAVIDALRLSRGMTYKCGISGVDFGGGKTVIIGDPQRGKSEELFRALGRFVETLGGRYYTGTDVGTTYDDFVYVSRETSSVVGLPEEYGGSGNSSIITAFGVWKGIKACARTVFGSDSLSGLTIAIQGLGKVGGHLVELLHQEGAELVVTDINEEYVRDIKERYPVHVVAPEEIFGVSCDIFSPNALGAVLNDETIPRLKCKIVAGAANNQLKEPRHGDMLFEKGVLYAPDYVINAGGLIQVADEFDGYSKDRAFKKAAGIYDTLIKIFAIARHRNIPPFRAVDEIVERRISRIGDIRGMYVGE